MKWNDTMIHDFPRNWRLEGSDFRRCKEFIEAQPQEELECIAKKLETGDAEVQVDGRSFTLTKALAVFERKKEKAGLAALTSLQSSAHFTPSLWKPREWLDD